MTRWYSRAASSQTTVRTPRAYLIRSRRAPSREVATLRNKMPRNRTGIGMMRSTSQTLWMQSVQKIAMSRSMAMLCAQAARAHADDRCEDRSVRSAMKSGVGARCRKLLLSLAGREGSRTLGRSSDACDGGPCGSINPSTPKQDRSNIVGAVVCQLYVLWFQFLPLFPSHAALPL